MMIETLHAISVPAGSSSLRVRCSPRTASDANAPSLGPASLDTFLMTHGMVPAALAWNDVVTSMFLHGGWMHLLGNMLYLWIFGDNIEKVMGAGRFLVFYLVCGLAASFAHIAFGGGSTVPAVGASGAISGVLGAYLVLFPRNQVRVLTRGGIMSVPAIVVLGFWILIQMISGLGSLTATSETAGGGVAYMAHIGGFVAGLILANIMTAGRQRVPA